MPKYVVNGHKKIIGFRNSNKKSLQEFHQEKLGKILMFSIDKHIKSKRPSFILEIIHVLT